MKVIAYQLLNCGDAVVIYQEGITREKIVEESPDLEMLANSGGKCVSKMEDLDKYLKE